MAFWFWLTPKGAAMAPGAQSHRGDVLRAIASTQPARSRDVRERAERDGMRTDGDISELVSFWLWRLRGSGLIDGARTGTAGDRPRLLRSAAAAPTLDEAIATVIFEPMPSARVAEQLRALGRPEVTDDAVVAALAAAVARGRVAEVRAADGRTLYVRKAGA